MIKTTATANVNHPDYNEAAALQELLKALLESVDEVNELYEERHEVYNGNVSITVGNTTVGLLLGGPQINGIAMLIETISHENGYHFEYVDGTVTDSE